VSTTQPRFEPAAAELPAVTDPALGGGLGRGGAAQLPPAAQTLAELESFPSDSPTLPAGDRLPAGELRISVVRAIAAWGFGAAFFNVTGGAVYASFVRQLSTNDLLFGALASALPLMSFLQVMAARIVERTGRRKRQMVVCGVIGRGLWLVAALLPLLWLRYPDRVSKGAMFNLLLICVAASGVFQAFTGPAFFSWMADLVPERVRPTFFASRMRIGTLAALLASIAGIVDVAMFIGVKEPAVEASAQGSGAPASTWRESIGEPLQDKAIRNFLKFVSLLMIGYGVQGAFLWLHALEYLHLSRTVTGLVLNGAPLLGMAVAFPFWSTVIKRYGTRPVMRLCSLGLCFIPLAWLTAQPHEYMGLLTVTFFSGIFAGGIDLSNQNIVTGLSPHLSRATLAALFSISGGLSMASASLLGGLLAQFLQGMQYHLWGFTIINYHILFLTAMLVRIVNAAVVAPRLKEPDAASTLETVKEIMPELAQNFADLLARPVRVRHTDHSAEEHAEDAVKTDD